MERKIPPEAFDFYVSLGLKRSYQTVAEKYGVSKVAVVNLAKREKWQDQIAQIDLKSRETTVQKAIQSREETTEHYLKIWSAVERRALEAIRSYPISSAMDAVRALDMVTKNILLVRGEPTERVENIELVIRREHERWMRVVEDDAPAAKEEPLQAEGTTDAAPAV